MASRKKAKKAAKKQPAKRSAARKPRPVGRPVTVMTPDHIKKIIDAVRLGIWPERAAKIHGISGVAMRMHKKRHPEFVTALEKAESEAQASIHGKILRHMDKQWTAAAWMLERRWPDDYASVEAKAKLNGGGAADAGVIVLGIEEFLKRAEAKHNPAGAPDVDAPKKAPE